MAPKIRVVLYNNNEEQRRGGTQTWSQMCRARLLYCCGTEYCGKKAIFTCGYRDHVLKPVLKKGKKNAGSSSRRKRTHNTIYTTPTNDLTAKRVLYGVARAGVRRCGIPKYDEQYKMTCSSGASRCCTYTGCAVKNIACFSVYQDKDSV